GVERVEPVGETAEEALEGVGELGGGGGVVQLGVERVELRAQRGLALAQRRATDQRSAALNEGDLDSERGAVLVRHGKHDKRREVGMDRRPWEQCRPQTPSSSATEPVAAPRGRARRAPPRPAAKQQQTARGLPAA
ncbi:MAG: hypothetical protein ACLQRH_09965, partial [Acidimicrobiales bacterium]